ncbi:nuclear transport factor 2 family protein [Runella sp.]|uniref:nuclear transport factor 2 family protein n=1 Tax=Runella sp. TaxID=1960881 RepID=UPI003D12C757
MKTNEEKVKALYEAFGQGNVPFILENVDTDFTWTDPSDAAIVPHGGEYKGREEFGHFFQKLSTDSDTVQWEVDNYTSNESDVIATGTHGIRVKETGKTAVTDWVMIWSFENGKPIKGRSYYDTATVASAFK